MVLASPVASPSPPAGGPLRPRTLRGCRETGLDRGHPVGQLLVGLLQLLHLVAQPPHLGRAVLRLADAVIVPDDPADSQSAPQAAPFRLSPAFAALASAYFLFGFGYIIPATFLPAMARAESSSGAGAAAKVRAARRRARSDTRRRCAKSW